MQWIETRILVGGLEQNVSMVRTKLENRPAPEAVAF